MTLSWIFTKLIPENKILNFGKLRLAYGKTGNDASPYQIFPRFTQGTAREVDKSILALDLFMREPTEAVKNFAISKIKLLGADQR